MVQVDRNAHDGNKAEECAGNPGWLGSPFHIGAFLLQEYCIHRAGCVLSYDSFSLDVQPLWKYLWRSFSVSRV